MSYDGKKIGNFRFWCQTVLPSVYDDSLSYYELLNKVVAKLNEVIEQTNDTTDEMIYLIGEFDTLKAYVDDYFDNLDVQEEINAKLDAMAGDGSLDRLVSSHIPSAVTDWLDENVDPSTTPVVDSSLTITGAAADAKTVGDLFDRTRLTGMAIPDAAITDIDSDPETDDESVDFNGIVKNGVYFISDTFVATVNSPYANAVGWLEVTVPNNANLVLQIFYPYSGSATAIPMRRVRNISGVWTSWLRLSDVPIAVDNTLLIPGDAADAKTVGDLFERTRLTGAAIPDDAIDDNSVDFDMIDKDGVYFISSVYTNNTHEPYTGAVGWLEVTVAANATLVLQIFYPYYGNFIPVVRFRDISSNWSTWKTFVNDQIDSLIYELLHYGNINYLAQGGNTANSTYNDVTYTYSNKKYHLTGTANGVSLRNIWSQSTQNTLPEGMTVGKTYGVFFASTNPNVIGQVFFYRNGSLDLSSVENIRNNTKALSIPDDVDSNFLVRIYVPDGIVTDGTTVEFAITPSSVGGTSVVNNFNQYNNAYTIENMSPTIISTVPYILTSTNDQTDRKNEIETLLNSTGCCILGTGDFYVSNVTVGNYKTLMGSGVGRTTIRMLSNATGNCFSLGTRSSISEMTIIGGNTVGDSAGNRNGISYNGTVTSISPTVGTVKSQGMIHDLVITGFNGAGLECSRTGPSNNNGIQANNISITNCFYGIRTTAYSEYNKFTNITCATCRYGCVNDGGNNNFVNCGFTGNVTAYAVLNLDENYTVANNTHNSCSSCSFNHSSGDGIVINNADKSLVFSACEFYDTSIKLTGSTGVVFNGCLYLSIPIEFDSGFALFNSCVFKTAPVVTKLNSPVVVASQCYLRDGTNITF